MTSQGQALRQAPEKGDRGILGDISVRDLLSLLGLGNCETSSDTERRLLCEEVQLEAGSSLYEQGQKGVKELIGLHRGTSGRPESATAITKATVLSFSIKAVQPSRSARLCQDHFWPVLPCLAGWLADFKLMMAHAEGITAMAMPTSNLASWLALDQDVLRAQLNRLACHGVVSSDANVIRWIAPFKLETLLPLM